MPDTSRETLERYQALIYLGTIILGLALGASAPDVAPVLETLLWPCLAVLLYATFTQVPLNRLPEAFGDRRFAAAALRGNFIAIPLLVWGLLLLVPDDPAVRLGVLLVLLVPCTDWFMTFAHLAGGDSRRAIVITPVNLLAQFALLPIYLWLFLGESFAAIVAGERVLIVFGVLIAAPLALAFLTERWAARRPFGAHLVERLGRLPVPLLATVVFLIAASQVGTVARSLSVLADVFLVFAMFLLATALLDVVTTRLFSLSVASGRALVFSFATRNSFVVLPFALALPAGWEVAAIVIVFQSLVELLGMVFFLWWVPRKLLPGAPAPA